MTCNDLATKSELNNLRNQLNASLDNLNFQKADRSALNNLEIKTAGINPDNFKPNLQPLEIALGVLAASVEFLKKGYSLLQKQTEASNKAVKEVEENIKNIFKDLKDYAKDIKQNIKDIKDIKKQANETQTLALYLELEINKIKQKANETTATANEAINRTNILLNSLNAVITKANHADLQAARAMEQANLAVLGAVTARDSLNQLIIKVSGVEAQSIQALNQANTAYQIGNIAQSQAASVLLKTEALTTDFINIKESIKTVNSEIELLKIKDLQQALKNIDFGYEMDALRLKNLGLTGEINRLEGLLNQSMAGALNAIDSKISENNKTILGSGAGAISATVKDLQKDAEATKGRIGSVESSLTGINTKINTLEQTQTKQQTEINQLDMNNTGQLTNIQTALGGLGLAVTGIAVQSGQIVQQTTPSAIASAAETGLCNSTKPGGCMQGALNPLQKGINEALSAVGPAGALAIQNAQVLNNTVSILSLLNTVWAYLQTFYNYTKGKFDKLWDFLGMDRLLNILNFAVGLHNAAMLSRNLVGTLIETTNNILTAVGVKNPEGQAVDIGPIIGGTVDSWMRNLLGAEVWSNTKETWKRANRILTAAARLKDATYAFGNSIAEIGENIGENVSQLSNAFIDEGLISPDYLDYKDPKPRYKQHFGRTQQFLSNLNESAEAINQFASQIIESTELATEMDKAFDEFKKEVENGGKEKKNEEEQKDKDSLPKVDINDDDLREGEEDGQ